MAPLKKLQNYLHQHCISALLIPREDEFLGEYVPDYNERLKWVTGFSGSAGLAIITPEKAYLFVDGRYTLQAKNEALDCEILPLHSVYEWLKGNIGLLGEVRANFKLHSHAFISRVQTLGIHLQHIDPFPVDVLWEGDRPEIEFKQPVAHGFEYSGESVKDKISRTVAALNQSVAALYIDDPHDLAWLLNIRGADLTYTPIALCRALLFKDGHVAFFLGNLTEINSLKQHVGEQVSFYAFDQLYVQLDKLDSVQVDSGVSAYDLEFLSHKAVIQASPIVLMRAIKNSVEIEGMRKAHQWDGVALTQFIQWVKSQPSHQLTEHIAAEKLEMFRRECSHYKGPSFPTISAFGENGAIVHYRHSDKSNKRFADGGLYLVDSGGQYLQGTTDVARTVYIGTPPVPNEYKRAYTYVLKGHLRLAAAIFPEGTTGHQLDSLARYDLWQRGLDYAHGTGHGVGSYLSVHEGPQSISPRFNATVLKPGMVLSNEPGYYKAGSFGIRIENLVLVKQSEYSGFLCFETLTQAPYDSDLIDESLLTGEEKKQLKL